MTGPRADETLPVARTVRRGDRAYPDAFERVASPPAWVRVRGPLALDTPAVAIVGARAATPYGRAFAHALARDLATLGFVIVSGLARGIDAAAHLGARSANGGTVAILPGGLEAVTPVHHAALARWIATHGALVSEHPDGMRATRGMFVRRNRLIAALGLATVVVEAASRSGALSTAAAARRIGRPVFAVPGDVDRETSRGCHQLLRDGARVCEGAGDVLRAVAVPAPRQDPPARVLAALGDAPRSPEALAAATGLALPDVLAALARLAWAGAAARRPGGRWVRGGGAACP